MGKLMDISTPRDTAPKGSVDRLRALFMAAVEARDQKLNSGAYREMLARVGA